MNQLPEAFKKPAIINFSAPACRSAPASRPDGDGAGIGGTVVPVQQSSPTQDLPSTPSEYLIWFDNG
jgi:hypothetical protein